MVVCDTSGRLHTNAQLMDELAKCKRAIGKRLSGAPHETLLVLDGTTGHSLATSSSLCVRLIPMIICLSTIISRCIVFVCQHHHMLQQQCVRSTGDYTPRHCVSASASSYAGAPPHADLGTMLHDSTRCCHQMIDDATCINQAPTVVLHGQLLLLLLPCHVASCMAVQCWGPRVSAHWLVHAYGHEQEMLCSQC